MSEFKVKRLITHKELDKVVDLRPSWNTHTGISLYQIGIYVYYNKGESPLDTGYSGFTRVESRQEVPSIIQKRHIVWSVNLGEWIEGILSKGLMPRKPNNVSIEDWVQALWTGDVGVLQTHKLALTQTQKREVKRVLYKQINQQGSIALYKQEAYNIQRMALNNGKGLSKAKGSLGKKLTETVESYEDSGYEEYLREQVGEWVKEYKVDTKIEANPKKLMKRLVESYKEYIPIVVSKYQSYEENDDGKEVYVSLRLGETKLSDKDNVFYEFGEQVFDEGVYSISEIIPSFNTVKGWELEMVEEFNYHIQESGFIIDGFKMD